MGFRGLKLIKELPRFHFSCLPAIYMLIGPATESERKRGGECRVITVSRGQRRREPDTSPSQGSGFSKTLSELSAWLT